MKAEPEVPLRDQLTTLQLPYVREHFERLPSGRGPKPVPMWTIWPAWSRAKPSGARPAHRAPGRGRPLPLHQDPRPV